MSRKLCVVVAYYNPSGYKARARLHQEFLTRLPHYEVDVLTVGAADRKENCLPVDIFLKTEDKMWYKENLYNIGFDALRCTGVENIAWMDGDVALLRSDWVAATIEALKENDVVQMFSEAVDLMPQYEVERYKDDITPTMPVVRPGFAAFQSTLKLGLEPLYIPLTPYGFAWAAKSAWLERVGGLCDTNILGSGDSIMAWSLYNQYRRAFPEGLTTEYLATNGLWQEKAKGTKVGYVPGLLAHYWHGDRKNRKYLDRWALLRDFKPGQALVRDQSGLLHWKDRNSVLARDVAQYFEGRKEDE